MTDAELSKLRDEGIAALMDGFSVVISALFEKSPIVSKEQNPFGELPKPVQVMMMRNALQMTLAQTMAAVTLISGDKLTEKEMMSSTTLVLKKYYTDYLKHMRSVDGKTDMGEGSKAGNAGSGLILTP